MFLGPSGNTAAGACQRPDIGGVLTRESMSRPTDPNVVSNCDPILIRCTKGFTSNPSDNVADLNEQVNKMMWLSHDLYNARLQPGRGGEYK